MIQQKRGRGLQGQLAPGAEVIAGAMVKHLPRAAGDLLERYIGLPASVE